MSKFKRQMPRAQFQRKDLLLLILAFNKSGWLLLFKLSVLCELLLLLCELLILYKKSDMREPEMQNVKIKLSSNKDEGSFRECNGETKDCALNCAFNCEYDFEK
jgi:hypothetical protein